MNQIAWDMRHSLPNQAYLDFVAQTIYPHLPNRFYGDPLAVDLDFDSLPGAYVLREHVTREINGEGFRIIIGPRGTGKTTLFYRALQPFPTKHPLVVRIHLSDLSAVVPFDDTMSGQVSLLTVNELTGIIFNTFWESFFHLDGTRRERYFSWLRQNLEWMVKLHWLYNTYRPTRHHITDDFELMAWLHSTDIPTPFNLPMSPRITLHELIQFITCPVPSAYDQQSVALYDHIVLLIDGTEMLSRNGTKRLIEDVERVNSMAIKKIDFKLFVDSTLQTLCEEMQCVQEGRAIIYQLPRWTDAELLELLMLRLTVWEDGSVLPQPGQLSTPDQRGRQRWSERISTLKPELKGRRFEEIIIQNAQKAHALDDPLAAPIHLLRLTRGMIAACAGCWESEFSHPLGYSQIERLAALYWGHPEGGEHNDVSES